MDKTWIKAICIITTFSMTIALFIGAIATMRSTSYLTEETDKKIVATAEKHANDFSAKFNHMEGLTDSLASYVLSTFDLDAYRNNNEEYMDQYKEELAEKIKIDLSSIKSAHSLYVTFNPELTSRYDEVWFSVLDGKTYEVSVDFQNNRRNFDDPKDKSMEYFFKPQGKNHGVWISPYYDKDINTEVFSYSSAIYIDGTFIGVAGADIDAKDIIKVINEKSAYKGGCSALLDENCRFIIHNRGDTLEEEKIIKRLLNDEFKKRNHKKAGAISYSFKDEKKTIAYSKMQNNWTFIMLQPEKELYKSINAVRHTMFILAFCLLIVFVAFLVVFSRPLIKKTSTLEEENRKKEIIIMYQSRQAKLGEMVGNITHQWKQPLNTINLILANLLDSYRYGDLDEKRLNKSVGKVENIVDKMSETITDFSDFLKPTKEKTYFNVSDCIESARNLMEESISIHKIKINVSYGDIKQAYGYCNDLTHVIFNLLNNARDSIVESEPDDRKIDIELSMQENMIKISVINTGGQIPSDCAEHIFEPYFTTKEDSGGTGLGLYISKQIMEDRMNGSIDISNIQGGVRCILLAPTEPVRKGDNEHR